jgi:hypothetical protein
MNHFHANGLADLLRDKKFCQEREKNKRRRIEESIAEHFEEFAEAGYWQKQRILKSIHQQVEREFSLEYCLF